MSRIEGGEKQGVREAMDRFRKRLVEQSNGAISDSQAREKAREVALRNNDRGVAKKRDK